MKPGPRPLRTLLAADDVLRVDGDADVLVSSITHDSRRVEAGSLFVAYRGVYRDVHSFLPDAAARGAAAAIVERPPRELRAELDLPPDFPLAHVASARFARSRAAAQLYGDPSRRLAVVGITGTDGKTTTSTLVHGILSAAGRRAGLVTTVGAHLGTDTMDTGLHTTTPEAEEVQAFLADMVEADMEVAVLEVTSHGLHQHRVSHVAFDVAAITNITHEALEYHESMAAYRAAKARLFHLLSETTQKEGSPRAAVLNLADASYQLLAAIEVARQWTYSAVGEADFSATGIDHGPAGLAFTARTPAGELGVASPLLGYYNVANILAAMAVAHALGAPPEAWARGVARTRGIPGRMEIVDEGQPFLALVDFAHTPNALRHALDTARELLKPAGRLIAVFGSAGLRDRAKREMMGAAAGEMADLTIVTAEDPRTEPIEDINAAIAYGLRQAGAREGEEYRCIPDRFAAIEAACAEARPSDVVIVLGKGHEQSMCFGETEYPWDDRAALCAALRGEAYGNLPTADRR
jgi:UDP-N-acetylmuramoyl-L-alanyl-D-glutamate--2,6-diaminopimelate ligase